MTTRPYGTIFVLLDSPWAVLEACEICKAKCMKLFPLFSPEMQKIHLHRKKVDLECFGGVSPAVTGRPLGTIFVLLDSFWSALNVYQKRNGKILETVVFTRGQS